MSNKRTSTRHRSAARQRMAQTGEKYTAALAAVLADARRGTAPRHHALVVRPFVDGSILIDFGTDHHLAIVGTSGSGKTVLAEEIVRQLRKQSVTVLGATDTHIDNADLIAEHTKNVESATKALGDRREAHARRDPLFLVLDRANYLDESIAPDAETLSRIRALLVDGGEYGIHVIVVQQSIGMSWAKDMISAFDLRVLMGNVSQAWLDRELRTDGVTKDDSTDRRGTGSGLYEDADLNLLTVVVKPKPTLVTGAPGYGFTAVEAMKARFPGENDEQIHARLIAEVATGTIEFPEGMLEPSGDDAR